VVLIDSGLRPRGTIVMLETIPAFHKVATRMIALGEVVIKFGEPIGRASTPISVGSHVHVQNIDSVRLPGAAT
jgi:altronate hydrolase